MTEHITVRRELLRQVLDFVDYMRYPQRLKDALRTALEQPAVEPYGWHVTGSNELLRGEYAQSDAESDAKRYGGTARAVALYTAPQAQQSAGEPTDAQIALLDPWMRPAAAKELLTKVLALSAAAPQAQPAVESASDLKVKWLGDALFGCIKAAKILRDDINELTVAELLHFAQDLKGQLERTAPQAQPAVEPVQTLIAKLQADPDYAWSWHCNIAMAYVDAGGDPYTGNQGAARFMKMFANVDPAHELPEPQAQQPAVEPYGHVTVSRLSQRFENHADQYTFYPAGQVPYLDNADECVTVFTAPPPPADVPLLTDDEIARIASVSGKMLRDYAMGKSNEKPTVFARALEAAVRQKAGLKP